MTEEKRLVLPPGTQLVLTPTLAMPLIRYPPHGMDANLTISTPFTSKNTHWCLVIKVTGEHCGLACLGGLSNRNMKRI